MAIVSPSILSANFNKLLEEIKEVEQYGAKYLHIDVMDGHFVPNISMGAIVYRGLKGLVNMVFDVHLMISDPKKYAKDFIIAGADIITFHFETITSSNEIASFIRYIKSFNTKVGISIKPNTDVRVLDEYLKNIDQVLIMSVEPGFGGQTFIYNALDKIKYLSQKRQLENLKFAIEVDGGINFDTAKRCVANGCDILVAGTYIFNSDNRQEKIAELIKL